MDEKLKSDEGRKVLGENGNYELREPEAPYKGNFDPKNGVLRQDVLRNTATRLYALSSFSFFSLDSFLTSLSIFKANSLFPICFLKTSSKGPLPRRYFAPLFS